MHVNFIMKSRRFYHSLYFWSDGEAIFPSGRRKFCWVKLENALGNGFENICWGDQTVPLERVTLVLLHKGILKFIPKFTYFALT